MTAEGVSKLFGALEKQLGLVELLMLLSDTGGDKAWRLMVSARRGPSLTEPLSLREHRQL